MVFAHFRPGILYSWALQGLPPQPIRISPGLSKAFPPNLFVSEKNKRKTKEKEKKKKRNREGEGRVGEGRGGAQHNITEHNIT